MIQPLTFIIFWLPQQQNLEKRKIQQDSAGKEVGLTAHS